MIWSKVEHIVGEKIPECIKKILLYSGYDTILSLKSISPERIEKHINDHYTKVLQDFDCCYNEFYKKQHVFKLLPGHYNFLLTLSECINNHTIYDYSQDPNSEQETERLKLIELVEKSTSFSAILKEIIKTAIRNGNSNQHKWEYSDVIRFFATYIYIIGGRSCYEVLYQNLPLPSRSTVLRCINDQKSRVVEGALRCAELRKFLEDHKTKKIVWLSEDATALVPKINYDPITNQLVGVILPTNNNGCPISFSFKATDSETIKQAVKEPMSRNVYVVVAQALDERIPPFILQIYGSNGSFTASDTVRRWHHTKLELEKQGIELAGISADGDPKILSAMVYEASLPKELGISITQDMIHTINKGRNRLLKPNIKLPMGTHTVTINHLHQLLANIHKSVHGLTYSDVFPVDRMNYDSCEKIMKNRVIMALRNRIPESEATVQYLTLFRDIANSYLLFDLKPLDRIHMIFRSLYFLRIWRKFIKSSRSYTLKDNFITYNTYTCIEINAKYLVNLIKTFRDRNESEQFLPALYDSQACEKSFRLFRSMGTTHFTKINFSLLELIHMIGRVEVQNDIAYCKLNIEGIKLPHKRTEKTKIYKLPTDDEICSKIAIAKEEAFEIAKKFKMVDSIFDIDEFDFTSKIRLRENDTDDHVDEDAEQEEQLYHEDDNELDDETEEMSGNASNAFLDELLDNPDTEDCPDSDVSSAFIYVNDENGLTKLIPKSTFVWMLTQPSAKISNDRLRRFKFNKTKRNVPINIENAVDCPNSKKKK